MEQIEEITKLLDRWKENGDNGNRSYLLYSVNGVGYNDCRINLNGSLVDLSAAIAGSMAEDKKVDLMIRSATKERDKM